LLEYELEALPELEAEYEGEWEGEWGELEGEFEGEEFFRRLAGLAHRAVQSPALRRVGLAAARSALHGLGGIGAGLGSSLGPRGAALARNAGGWMPQSELEGEMEWELEGELLMEHLGHAAAEAESEEEAEAFLPALIPLAAQIAPRIAPVVMRAAPHLIRGVANIGRTLRRSPGTRQLVRTVPTIVRRTAANLAQQVAQGQRVTPQGAVRTLARQAQRTLSSPGQCAQAYRRSRALDRRYHRTAGRLPALAGRR
jgi:hypothetical protein